MEGSDGGFEFWDRGCTAYLVGDLGFWDQARVLQRYSSVRQKE